MQLEPEGWPRILWGWIHDPLPMTPEQRAAAKKYTPPDHAPKAATMPRTPPPTKAWASALRNQNATGKKKRFTVDEVRWIKRELAKGTPQKVISDRFECTPSAIWAIEHGKAWKHVTI